MSNIEFTFSDAIAGYVTAFNRTEKSFGIQTSDGREFQADLTPTVYARITHNLAEPYNDGTGRLAELLALGQHVFAYGIFYPQGDGHKPENYRHEEPDWWVKQIHSIASYFKWQFNYPNQEIDCSHYRTYLNLAGEKKQYDYLQETDRSTELCFLAAVYTNLPTSSQWTSSLSRYQERLLKGMGK